MIFLPGNVQSLITNPSVEISRPHGLSSLVTSLVSFWPLNEASGNAADSVGSNTLADNNTVTSATGLVYATARDFEATNIEQLTIAHNASLATGDIQFWAAAWVKFESAPAVATIMGKGSDYAATLNEWMMFEQSGTYRFQVSAASPTAVNSAIASTVGTWQLIVVSYEPASDTAAISVDNSAFVTGTLAGGPTVKSGESFRIGGSSNTARVMDGLVGPVMFGKSYIPTTADVAFLYNSGAGRTLEAMRDY